MSTSKKIDELGGMVEAVSSNYPQREIADAAFALQQQIDAGERIVVGVNSFLAADEQPIPTLRVDPALERKQIDRLQAPRARRDGAAVERALAALREDAAHEDRNLMEPLLDLRPRPRQRGRDHRVAAAGVRRLHRDAGFRGGAGGGGGDCQAARSGSTLLYRRGSGATDRMRRRPQIMIEEDAYEALGIQGRQGRTSPVPCIRHYVKGSGL